MSLNDKIRYASHLMETEIALDSFPVVLADEISEAVKELNKALDNFKDVFQLQEEIDRIFGELGE